MPDPVHLALMALTGQNCSEKGARERGGVNMWLEWGDLRQNACSFPTSESFLECREGPHQSHWDHPGSTGWVSPIKHGSHSSQSPFAAGQAVWACPEAG